MEITDTHLARILTFAAPERIALYLPGLNDGMAARAITTPLRVAHFLAQIGHESGHLRYNEEIADGAAYDGRADLGNTQRGDGRRFKGRGLIQLTGRANYAAYGAAIGRDLLSDPDAVAMEPALAVDVACWFWASRGLNVPADADDLERLTRRVNGGLSGLADRRAILARAKVVLGIDAQG